VLDLGQVTWSRLEEKTPSQMEAGVQRLPDPSLAQVLSPGAYLVLGLGRSPFTIGVGASIAPDLRIYTATDQTDRALTVWRLGFFLAVDVTVFPLW
jgi:hypothetical protein